MPGTIQVSVLELMGLPSSPPPSSISIKVSMGKREYQTFDKGDFTFPLTTLRETLIVRLQDDEGKEISQTGIGIMSIVERGVWDDFFPLEGGGHVHMKLQFTLSDDERNRIRSVRESALKKKQAELLSSGVIRQQTSNVDGGTAALSPRHNDERESALKKNQAELLNSSVVRQETANIDGSMAAVSPRHNDEVSGSEKSSTFSESLSSGVAFDQRALLSDPVSSSEDRISNAGKKEEASTYQEPKNTNDTDRIEESSSAISISQLDQLPKDLSRDSERSHADSTIASAETTDRSEESSSTISISQVDELPKDLSRNSKISDADGITTSPTFTQETASALGSSESAVAEKNSSVSIKIDDGLAIELEKQAPLKKSLSNVKKMATAFESSLQQDTRPLIKGPTVKPLSNRIGTDGLIKDQNPKNISDPPKLDADKLKNPFLTGVLQQIQRNIRKKNEHDGFDTDSGWKDTPKHSKESSTMHIQPKELNSNAMNKLNLLGDGDRKERTQTPDSFIGKSAVETTTLIKVSVVKQEQTQIQKTFVGKPKVEAATLIKAAAVKPEQTQIQKDFVGKPNVETVTLIKAPAVKQEQTQLQEDFVGKPNVETVTFIKDPAVKQEQTQIPEAFVEKPNVETVTLIKAPAGKQEQTQIQEAFVGKPNVETVTLIKAPAVKQEQTQIQKDFVGKPNVETVTLIKAPAMKQEQSQIPEAFLGKPNVETTTLIKDPRMKPQINRVVIKSLVKDQNLTNLDDSAKLSPDGHKNPSLTGEFQQIQTNIGKANEHDGFDPDSGRKDMPKHTKESSMMPEVLNSNARSKLKLLHKETRHEQRQPTEILMQTSDEKASFSGKMSNEHSSRGQTRDLPTAPTDPCCASTENWTQATSNDTRKSAAYCQGGDYSLETSRARMFPDDSIYLCITATSKDAMDLIEGCHVDAHQGEMNVSATEFITEHDEEGEADVDMIRELKTSRKQRKPKPESPEDVTSAGFGGQAIKIAIMMGFGALVLFTRQRKPRKSYTETNQPFLAIPEYLDQAPTGVLEWRDRLESRLKS